MPCLPFVANAAPQQKAQNYSLHLLWLIFKQMDGTAEKNERPPCCNKVRVMWRSVMWSLLAMTPRQDQYISWLSLVDFCLHMNECALLRTRLLFNDALPPSNYPPRGLFSKQENLYAHNFSVLVILQVSQNQKLTLYVNSTHS